MVGRRYLPCILPRQHNAWRHHVLLLLLDQGSSCYGNVGLSQTGANQTRVWLAPIWSSPGRGRLERWGAPHPTGTLYHSRRSGLWAVGLQLMQRRKRDRSGEPITQVADTGHFV